MSDKFRTITLTGRPPVRIREQEWPVIATAHDTHSCGEQSQNGEVTRSLRVRQHNDGRALVYATTQGGCQCSLLDVRGGVLVESAGDIPSAVGEVAELLRSARCGAYPMGDCRDDDEVDLAIRTLVRECIADLPAEEL